MWIDTHCHLDAPEFGPDHALAQYWRAQAASKNVALCVLPAVSPAHFPVVRSLAHALGDAYALGIHPLWAEQAANGALAALEQSLLAWRNDPRLVAVGEIGLDFFVPHAAAPEARARQVELLAGQLRLARRFDLPVLLHTRRANDEVLAQLRRVAPGGWRGIAHAFNGSAQQASAFGALGLKLGFGGACTFERALQLRRLAATQPDSAPVLETDAPDIPPQWLYRDAAARKRGEPQGLNTPAELPRIGAELARLRGLTTEAMAALTSRNALQALPGLARLLPCTAIGAGPATGSGADADADDPAGTA